MVQKIETPNQYLITKAVLADFEHALETVKRATDMHPIQQNAYIEAYQSQIDELRSAIGDYEEKEGE